MHPTSKYIKDLVGQTPGYSLEILCVDLGLAQDELLTPTETCRELKISMSTLNRMQVSGKLAPHFIGTRRRFKRSELNALIAR